MRAAPAQHRDRMATLVLRPGNVSFAGSIGGSQRGAK